MKQFNTFAELASARILTGTPVTVLKPSKISGIVEETGEGLTLLSGNVFVAQFDDQEAITGRKTSLIVDEFMSGFTTNISSHVKDTSGFWSESSYGRTDTVAYLGQIWWPILEIPYREGGYVIDSWQISSVNSDILELTSTDSLILQFTRYKGVGPGEDIDYGYITDTVYSLYDMGGLQ